MAVKSLKNYKCGLKEIFIDKIHQFFSGAVRQRTLADYINLRSNFIFARALRRKLCLHQNIALVLQTLKHFRHLAVNVRAVARKKKSFQMNLTGPICVTAAGSK
jgi:hypothetical protein